MALGAALRAVAAGSRVSSGALAAAGETHDVTVLVMSGQKMVLVTPGKEFDLGVVGADQRIVREIDGNRVVGATVVNNSEMKD